MSDEELEAQLQLRTKVEQMVRRLVAITAERLEKKIEQDAITYQLTAEQKNLRETALNSEEAAIVQMLAQIAAGFLAQQNQG